MVPVEYLGAQGKPIHEKNLKSRKSRVRLSSKTNKGLTFQSMNYYYRWKADRNKLYTLILEDEDIRIASLGILYKNH